MHSQSVFLQIIKNSCSEYLVFRTRSNWATHEDKSSRAWKLEPTFSLKTLIYLQPRLWCFCLWPIFLLVMNSGFLWNQVMYFRVHRRQGMSWVAEWPFASWPTQLIPPHLILDLRKLLFRLSLAKSRLNTKEILKTCELFIYAVIHYITK
jgi:hypothetical protein